ncbi:MAG TPA: sugar phosphate nucleotidyltransferase [Flavisolibacter sp.]|jgi:NDP-sugar pyrophosphorylase family protein|nr:sugar phosphate nucleotidyltransferase [Flavisolibacter sp.]
MLFAAGLGTRFKPWTDKHPKALAIVNGKTLLQRNIEYLQKYDITDVVVNVHHFPDQVIDAIDKNDGWGSTITISDESDELLDTGGGLLKAKHLLFRDTILTLNVDILTEINIKDFLVRHQHENSLITVAVSDRNTSRYLLFNKYNRLVGWRNRKTGETKIVIEAKDIFEKAYSGMAIFQPEALDLITLRGKFSLIDAYLQLAPQNKIAAYDHTGERWVDVGKSESVVVAEQMFP